jgi:hypothetical protein
MATRENSGTNIDPGIIQRVSQGLRYIVRGVGPENWFGPMQPLPPQAQERSEGRAFDYPVGYNIRIQPRSDENISFWQLRQLADAYDLLRLVIETRKDQIKSFDWEITSKDPKKAADESKVKAVTEFFQSPDKEHSFDDWLSMLIEDLLVIDAVCVYPRMSRGGKLYAFELVDGATIKRVLDETGRTPEPPSPAYQQIIKGIPSADYTRDTLDYWVRNPRTNRVYGMSPVEQVIMTVNIGLRRQLTQLDYYTLGNVPEAIAQVPDTWTPKMITDFQIWWDSVNEGAAAQAKRKMRFIPKLDNIVFPRQATLKDEYDEWLARIVCFAFSISPTSFVKQVNRATAEEQANTAKEEGLKPLLKWIERKLTHLIARHLNAPDLEFSWKIVNEVDPKAQAEIDSIYISSKVMTPDEVRENLGMDAMTPEEREKAFPEPVSPFGDMGAGGEKPGFPPNAKEGGQEGGQKPPGAPAEGGEGKDKQDGNVVAMERFRQAALGKVLVGQRLADGRMIARWVDDPEASKPNFYRRSTGE